MEILELHAIVAVVAQSFVEFLGYSLRDSRIDAKLGCGWQSALSEFPGSNARINVLAPCAVYDDDITVRLDTKSQCPIEIIRIVDIDILVGNDRQLNFGHGQQREEGILSSPGRLRIDAIRVQ